MRPDYEILKSCPHCVGFFTTCYNIIISISWSCKGPPKEQVEPINIMFMQMESKILEPETSLRWMPNSVNFGVLEFLESCHPKIPSYHIAKWKTPASGNLHSVIFSPRPSHLMLLPTRDENMIVRKGLITLCLVWIIYHQMEAWVVWWLASWQPVWFALTAPLLWCYCEDHTDEDKWAHDKWTHDSRCGQDKAGIKYCIIRLESSTASSRQSEQTRI